MAKLETKDRIKPHSALERAASSIAIISLMSGFTFLYSNYSSSIQLSPGTSSPGTTIIGTILLTLGIIAALIWISYRIKLMSEKSNRKKLIKKKKI